MFLFFLLLFSILFYFSDLFQLDWISDQKSTKVLLLQRRARKMSILNKHAYKAHADQFYKSMHARGEIRITGLIAAQPPMQCSCLD